MASNSSKTPEISTTTRREMFHKVVALTLTAVAPAALLGCSKSPSCTDTGGLSADELKTRNETAQYQEQSMDATKHCASCSLFIPAESGCGNCKVLKGPINPNGYCKLYVGKMAQKA